MPFDALQPDTSVPDLTKPSAEALAYVLRHKELWPTHFKQQRDGEDDGWYYGAMQTCAVGLMDSVWSTGVVDAPSPAHKVQHLLGLATNQVERVFFDCSSSGYMLKPEQVAARLEYETASSRSTKSRAR